MPGGEHHLSGIVCAKDKKMVAFIFTKRIPSQYTIDFQHHKFNQSQSYGDISWNVKNFCQLKTKTNYKWPLTTRQFKILVLRQLRASRNYNYKADVAQ